MTVVLDASALIAMITSEKESAKAAAGIADAREQRELCRSGEPFLPRRHARARSRCHPRSVTTERGAGGQGARAKSRLAARCHILSF